MNPTEAPSLISLELQHEVEQFLFMESQLLDERRFDDWQALVAEDIRYRVPTRRNLGRRELGDSDASEPDELALFDDTKQTLGWRLARLRSGFAWAEQPPSRTRRLITNIRLTPSETEGEFNVSSNFVLYCNRFECQVELFVGHRKDVIRRGPDGQLLLAERTVLLDQTTVLADSISVLF